VAEQSEAGWGVAQLVVDEHQHALQIPINVVVPEAQYSEASPDKVTIPTRIPTSMPIKVVLTAVDLNYKLVFETDEIYDVATARRLAAEVESLLSPGAQMNP
jgi:hypothetical protein